MEKPDRLAQRPVDEALQGSLADIAAGRVEDFDSLLRMLRCQVEKRIAEIGFEAAAPAAEHPDA